MRSNFVGVIAPPHSLDDLTVLRQRVRALSTDSVFREWSWPSAHVIVATTPECTTVAFGETVGIMAGHEYLVQPGVREGGAWVPTPANAESMDGSFALLHIDGQRHCVSIITDRVNSRKVFTCLHDGCTWFATSINHLPHTAFRIDRTAVASYLASGVLFNNRTLFEGIRVLPRASTHTLTADTLESTEYWLYSFAGKEDTRPVEALQADLSGLLVQSVKRRTDPNVRLHLSLSAGYDSRTLLGLLSSPTSNMPVSCFSYAHGEPREQSDAAISHLLAEHSGFSHQTVESYEGDFMVTLASNVARGHGIANFCDEVDAWKQLMTQGIDALMVGDECFGWGNIDPVSSDDVLDLLGIHNFQRIANRSFLEPGVAKDMEERLDAEIEVILGRTRSESTWRDRLDVLYLDQRLSHLLMPWREYFAGSVALTHNPFLDRDILTFMTGVPGHLRRNKSLFRSTVESLFPDLFALPMATVSGYAVDWRSEMVAVMPQLHHMINNRESRLDEVIPSNSVMKATEQQMSKQDAIREKANRFQAGVTRRAKTKLPDRVRSILPSPRKTVSAPLLAQRLLLLRAVLDTEDVPAAD